MLPTSKSPLQPGHDSARTSRTSPLRMLRTAAVGLMLGIAAPAFADNLPDVQRLIKQAQYPQALEKVDAYLASRPKDAQGRFLKGLIYTEMNRTGEAIAVFTKLAEDYPELPEPYNNLAVLHAQQKQYDKARAALEMAIRTHPSYAIAYENLGDIYAKLASQAYDKALQLDSANSATQNKLALIRDLITTTGRGNVKPNPVAASTPAAAPSTVAPAAKPATTVAATPPAAATLPPPPPVVAAKPSLTPATPASAPPQATAPAPGKTAAETAVGKVDPAIEDINKALAAWAGAWMRKEMKAYFAAYASDFETPKGISRKAWEEEREQRIAGKGGKISISYDTPKITIDGNQATVKLRQHYKAPGISTSASKVMIFVRSGGKWLIKEEKSR